jgi:hypothetical protein
MIFLGSVMRGCGKDRCRGAESEGRRIPGCSFRAYRRLESFLRNAVLTDATPRGPAPVQHTGVNASVERATRAGAADAHIFLLRLPIDPFRTSRCTSLMRLPSDMDVGTILYSRQFAVQIRFSKQIAV